MDDGFCYRSNVVCWRGCSYKGKPVNNCSDSNTMTKNMPTKTSVKSRGHFLDLGSAPWLEVSPTIELDLTCHDFGIRASGTATGAVARYNSPIRWNMNILENKLPSRPKYYWLPIYYWAHTSENGKLVAETTLDMDDWHRVLSALFNCGVMEWGKGWGNRIIVWLWDMDSMTDSWDLKYSYKMEIR